MPKVKCEVFLCEFNDSTSKGIMGNCLKDEINIIFKDDEECYEDNDCLDCLEFELNYSKRDNLT